MDWRGRRTSDNIEDRRGGGGMGGPVRMGGIGVIVVLLIGAFLGVDVSPLLTGGGQVVTSGPAGPNEISDEDEEFVAVVLAETETTWQQLFAESNLRYVDPKLVLFTGAVNSACGTAQSAMGPFYCPNDQKVYLDMGFFDVMTQQLGSRGEFARAYVIAHEVGHHVQNQLGVLGDVNRRRSAMNDSDSNAMSVMVELQADCYAGIWAATAAKRLKLTDEDIRSALDTAGRIGDDTLQRASQGRIVPDSFTHGSSRQRQEWFYRGFKTGDPDQCDTFGAKL